VFACFRVNLVSVGRKEKLDPVDLRSVFYQDCSKNFFEEIAFSFIERLKEVKSSQQN